MQDSNLHRRSESVATVFTAGRTYGSAADAGCARRARQTTPIEYVRHRLNRKAVGEAHLTEPGIAAEERTDVWMHEHAPAAELEVDAVVGEGPLNPQLIGRVREEGYSNEGM